MTEAEILQNAIQAAQAATQLFSVFLTIVSAYVVGLYLFLNSTSRSLRFIAFVLLSVALLTIGALAWNLQYLGEGMHEAWSRLSNRSTGLDYLGPPLIVRSVFVNGGIMGMWAGWAFGILVYFALFYMTFLYRWPKDTSTSLKG